MAECFGVWPQCALSRLRSYQRWYARREHERTTEVQGEGGRSVRTTDSNEIPGKREPAEAKRALTTAISRSPLSRNWLKEPWIGDMCALGLGLSLIHI